MLVQAQQGDTVDLMCWRYYGSTRGLVELVMERNPGLADHGPVLPHGLVVDMPDKPAKTTTRLLQLWD